MNDQQIILLGKLWRKANFLKFLFSERPPADPVSAKIFEHIIAAERELDQAMDLHAERRMEATIQILGRE